MNKNEVYLSVFDQSWGINIVWLCVQSFIHFRGSQVKVSDSHEAFAIKLINTFSEVSFFFLFVRWGTKMNEKTTDDTISTIESLC